VGETLLTGLFLWSQIFWEGLDTSTARNCDMVGKISTVSPRVLRARLFGALHFLESDDVQALLRAKCQYANQVGNMAEHSAVLRVKDATKNLKDALDLFDKALVIEMETVSKRKEVC